MKTVVFCEGAQAPAAELLGKARELGGHVIALAEGESADLSTFFAAGADEVYGLEKCEDTCAQGTRIAQALRQLAPDAVLFSATVRGRFLSAWVAAKLDTGLTADCTALSRTAEGLLLQSRPAFGANLMADILCRTARPQMASVRPGIFPVPDMTAAQGEAVKLSVGHTKAHAVRLAVRPIKARMELTGFTPIENTLSLQDAPLIIAGGKGIGSKQGFEKLSELAALLGGAVGATRSAVDAGWIDYAHQIGQTGVTVRPKRYIAFGISGMVQHIVGMNGSAQVIAVNRDRNAPIFSYADYGIAADWEEVCDAMIAQAKQS